MLLAADSPDLSTSPDCGLAFFFTSRAPPPGAQLSPLYSPLSRVAASPHPCSLCSVVVALFTALPALLTRPHHPPQRRAQTLPKCVFDLAAGARARASCLIIVFALPALRFLSLSRARVQSYGDDTWLFNSCFSPSRPPHVLSHVAIHFHMARAQPRGIDVCMGRARAQAHRGSNFEEAPNAMP